jgi:hypothetical protein
MRFGRETGLALLKLKEIVRSNCGKWGRWWQANEDRFEYPTAAHACTLQLAKLPDKKWQRVAVIRPLFLWRIFRGSAGAGSLEGILNKLLC